jgi:chromosome segregation and condensation protein ScpB
MTSPKKKMATKEMCEQIIQLGMEGASQKMMWSTLGISKNTAETLKKNDPAFAEALDLALVHSQAYWERQILANVDNKGFNSRLVEIALRGQFQQDYRETRDNKVDVKAEVTIDFGKEVSDLISALKQAK